MTGAKKIISWNTGGLKDITRRHKKDIFEKADESECQKVRRQITRNIWKKWQKMKVP